ncbi:DUF59 domain-containing protein [Candidatus Sumerlaeota bacterium]|nr:DUF59 domain-containing protein [Candidatus Sumerlaeota bacterium]
MNEQLENKVWDVLKSVYDPELPVNIVELGLIYKVAVDGQGAAKIVMTLTSPTCAVAEILPRIVETKAKSVEGITNVEVEITWDPPWTKDRMSHLAKVALNLL